MNELSSENFDALEMEDLEIDASQDEDRSNLKWLIIGVVLLAAVGFAVWKFVLPEPAAETDAARTVEPPRSHPPDKPPPFGEVYVLQDMIINPASLRHHFMVSVGLEVSDIKQIEIIKKREPLLRDNLITLFSSQPIEVLANIKYRQAFRNRVIKIMDYQLGEGRVTRVFFQKWVFQ